MVELPARIRPARRTDIPALADLRVRHLSDVVHGEPRRRLAPDVREQSRHLLPVWLGQPRRRVFVAEGSDGIDGYAMGVAEVHPPVFGPQHVGVIAECFVKHAARGVGLAGAFLEALTGALTALDVQVLRADVPLSDPHVAAALQAHGFTPLQRTCGRTLGPG